MKVEENKMKINKATKIIVMIIMFIVLNIPNFVEANENFNLDEFQGGSVPTSVQNLTENTLGAAVSVVRIVGIGIAITIITVLAIKYMMASAGDRADIKRHAVPFFIGAIVLFGASGILGILVNFANSISGV